MKGNEINKRDLEKYDNKIIWVEFDCTDITLDGNDESYNYTVEMLENENPDGCFILDYKNEMLSNPSDITEIPISLNYNLIYKFYEWDEQVFQSLFKDVL